MKKLLAPISILSIFLAAVLVLPAHAGGRDGGNGPKYLPCSELEGLSALERRDNSPGQRVRCVPDRGDHGLDLDQAAAEEAGD